MMKLRKWEVEKDGEIPDGVPFRHDGAFDGLLMHHLTDEDGEWLAGWDGTSEAEKNVTVHRFVQLTKSKAFLQKAKDEDARTAALNADARAAYLVQLALDMKEATAAAKKK